MKSSAKPIDTQGLVDGLIRNITAPTMLRPFEQKRTKAAYKQKTVYFSDEQMEQLRLAAFNQKIEQSEIVRQALDRFFESI